MLTGLWYSAFRSNLVMLLYYAFHYRALHTMYILYSLDYRSPVCMTVVICLSTLFSPITDSSITLPTIPQRSCTPCLGAQRCCVHARTLHQAQHADVASNGLLYRKHGEPEGELVDMVRVSSLSAPVLCAYQLPVTIYLSLSSLSLPLLPWFASMSPCSP